VSLAIVAAMALDLVTYSLLPPAVKTAESNPLAALGLPAVILLKLAATVALVLLVSRMRRYRIAAFLLAVGLPLAGAASNLRGVW
jgi:hypothetical protein